MVKTVSQKSFQPSANIGRQLKFLLQEFDAWATAADHTCADWRSDFPRWRDLIASANACLLEPNLGEEGLRLVGDCWVVSEENEECSDFAETYIDDPVVLHKVLCLSKHSNWKVRWQAYSVLGFYTGREILLNDVLETGLLDAHALVRLHAFYALMKNSSDAYRSRYILSMMKDNEEHNRYAAVVAATSLEESLKEPARLLLEQDAVVRNLFNYYLDHKELLNN